MVNEEKIYLIKQIGEAAMRGKFVTNVTLSGHYDPRNQVSLDFTPTELRIIRLICEDKDSKQIAAELLVSLGTVNKYRSEIMEKIGAETTTGVIMWAVRNGVVRG